MSQPVLGIRDLGRWIGLLLAPDAAFLRLALVYGIAAPFIGVLAFVLLLVTYVPSVSLALTEYIK